MTNSRKGAARCRHCGGALIERFGEGSCVMCGRAAEHMCDLCQFVEPPKPEPKKRAAGVVASTTRKGAKKKASV
ncbi:MAG: hypothetical protein HQK87_07385 [Nitrospinae bacterium]|nr:hypothetical protein [Nitrospinota bacterium]